jgi:hypothetical protein
MNEPGPDDPIDMLEVRLVARQLAGGKVHHHSSHVILEAVNEILRRRRERNILQTESGR